MKPYNPKVIEPKWQKVWQDIGLYKTDTKKGAENYYLLTMFPYPSGDLHTGHWYAYTGPDIYARYLRMSGKNVLYPMGFDAFGLPAENAAIKNNVAPAKWTRSNIETMTEQLKTMGTMYDWQKSLNTSEPEYYKWTQWLFLHLYKKGLAYRKKASVNWCPKDKTVLANEQVITEKNICERCGTPVEQKELAQWFFKITDFSEKLLTGLEKLDWPERVKTMQANWIGKSQGAVIKFKVEGGKSKAIEVFTTRLDTIFGATFLVLAPEHPAVERITTAAQKTKVESYKNKVTRKTELERLEAKAKSGVFSGAYVINPATKKKIPIWVSDYVLYGYGTGAIMAVPAHDVRDYEFAKHFKLPIKKVISSDKIPYTGEGKLVGSGKYSNKASHSARPMMVADFVAAKIANKKVQYRLRDWLISRQRYWGAPIPIVYCDSCGIQPVPEKDLPVKLPTEVKFKPTGKSPLGEISSFVNTVCPKCKGSAKRETDTMDTFVDSSWYFLRYPNPKPKNAAFEKKAVEKWLPVKHYLGGVEHAILHLLYARFITKVLHQSKLVGFDEPFLKLSNQGTILGPDGQKMSKSRGNVVSPEEQVSAYGADAFRGYLMFTGPWEEGGPYNTQGIAGVRRFLERVWNLARQYKREHTRTLPPVDNQSIHEAELIEASAIAAQKVTFAIRSLSFNTALAQLMELTNKYYKVMELMPFGANPSKWRPAIYDLLKLLAPFAPHIAEEIWFELGESKSIHIQKWPSWDKALIKPKLVNIAVQVKGKTRAVVTVNVDATQAEVEKLALLNLNVKRRVHELSKKKIIFVKNKVINFV